MRASEFLEEFANLTGRDAAKLRVIDRALAEAGLRAKAVGSRLPNISTGEAIYLLFAVLGGFPITHSANNAKDLARFELLVNQKKKDVSALAKALDIKTDYLEHLSLADVVKRICRRLALGQISPSTKIKLEVEGGAIATISINAGLESGKITFVGATDVVPRDFLELRVVNQNILRWIGTSTSAHWATEDE